MADEPVEPDKGEEEPDEEPEPAPDKGADPAAEVAKWKGLARKHEQQSKANALAAKKLTELEEKDKSESEKLTDRATVAESRAAEAELRVLKLEVAGEKGLTPSQAKRLQGTDRESLEADADELLESFKPDPDSKKTPRRRPDPNLPGSGLDPNEEPEETDPMKLAAKVPRW